MVNGCENCRYFNYDAYIHSNCKEFDGDEDYALENGYCRNYEGVDE